MKKINITLSCALAVCIFLSGAAFAGVEPSQKELNEYLNVELAKITGKPQSHYEKMTLKQKIKLAVKHGEILEKVEGDNVIYLKGYQMPVPDDPESKLVRPFLHEFLDLFNETGTRGLEEKYPEKSEDYIFVLIGATELLQETGELGWNNSTIVKKCLARSYDYRWKDGGNLVIKKTSLEVVIKIVKFGDYYFGWSNISCEDRLGDNRTVYAYYFWDMKKVKADTLVEDLYK